MEFVNDLDRKEKEKSSIDAYLVKPSEPTGIRWIRSPKRPKSKDGVDTLSEICRRSPSRCDCDSRRSSNKRSCLWGVTRLLGSPQSTVSRHLKVLQKPDGSRGAPRGPPAGFAWLRCPASDARSGKRSERHTICPTPHSTTRSVWRVFPRARGGGWQLLWPNAQALDALRRELYGDNMCSPPSSASYPTTQRSRTLVANRTSRRAPRPACAQVIGVDREPAMLGLAKQRPSGSECGLAPGGLERFPLDDHEIDAARVCLFCTMSATSTQRCADPPR